MPKGPKGEKRKADVIGNAVLVMKIATGQVKEATPGKAAEGNRKGGLKGGKARAIRLTPQQRKEIAKKAAATRWGTEAAAAPARKEPQKH
jgi:hypothetical protein